MRLTKAQIYVLETLLLKHYYDNEWEPFENLWPAKNTTANALTRHKLIERKISFAYTAVYESDKQTERHYKTTYAYRLTQAGRDLLDQRAEQRRAKEGKN
mgnify:CR=1 FL=1